MKTFIKLGFIACLSISLVTIASAAHNNKNMANANAKWVCETNASGASSDSDKMADESMKKAKSLKSAFDFAFKHCRDCTKITCTMENK